MSPANEKRRKYSSGGLEALKVICPATRPEVYEDGIQGRRGQSASTSDCAGACVSNLRTPFCE
jgi:hypothetical protein